MDKAILSTGMGLSDENLLGDLRYIQANENL